MRNGIALFIVMSNSNPQQSTRSQRREQAAADALRSLIRDTLLDKFPVLAEEHIEIPLHLSLKLTGEALKFTPDLRSQILEQAEAFLAPCESFHPGSVFDFHARTAEAPGCRPPGALDVFAGYDPLGHPKWSRLSAMLPEGLPLKIFSGKELKTEQLLAHGKNDKNYNLLGQLILGPLPVPRVYQNFTESPECALTLQIVEVRDAQAHFSLRVNLLCGKLLAEELEAMIQENPLREVNRALLQLREEVGRLEAQALEAWCHQDSKALSLILKAVPKIFARFSAQMEA
jgi:hypothetical protein